jgi:hypothetical protein
MIVSQSCHIPKIWLPYNLVRNQWLPHNLENRGCLTTMIEIRSQQNWPTDSNQKPKPTSNSLSEKITIEGVSHRGQGLLSHRGQGLLSHRGQWLIHNLTLSPKIIPHSHQNQQLIPRGSQTAHDRKHDCYNSCTLCRGLCPIFTCSDFIIFQRLENLHIVMSAKAQAHFLGCASRRSLQAFTKVYSM